MTGRLNGHDGDPLAARNARINRGELINDPRPNRQRGEGVTDPRDAFVHAPEYTPGKLPHPYEAYVDSMLAAWGGDPGPYACAFLAMHCGVLHSTVKVNTNPLMPNHFRNPNDFSLTLGRSGQKKSGMFNDLTRFQREWQLAQARASAKKMTKGPRFRPVSFLQAASIEGMMMQIADNQGERLLVGSEEAMSFYGGAAAHRKDDAARAMASDVCAVYDGGIYTKRLVKQVYDIPECLATLVMTTVFEKLSGWKPFRPTMEDGLWARHTVGLVAYTRPSNPGKVNPQAEEDLRLILLKMRGMQDMRFKLEPAAAQSWLSFGQRKGDANDAMANEKSNRGLELWCRKYDLRIMSMAMIFQAYDYIAGGMMEHTAAPMPQTDDDKTGEPRMLKTVLITRENLARAIDVVEGYLYDVQEYFYRVAAGLTEFGPELVNWMANRIANKHKERPDRTLNRGDLTSRGPTVCRGAITPELKETHKRWIDALMDHGFIEPAYDVGYAHKRYKPDNELAWYRIRAEFHEYFESDEVMAWAVRHDTELKSRMTANGIGPGAVRRPLAL